MEYLALKDKPGFWSVGDIVLINPVWEEEINQYLAEGELRKVEVDAHGNIV